MNKLLWVLQVVFGAYFVFTGISHFIVPPGLPAPMSWMYELDPTLHAISGAAEILGGLGLILPGLTRIMPVLTVWAAIGLAAVMVLAAVWHVGRGELTNIGMNLVVAAIMAFIAYRRATVNRIEPRSAGA